MDNDKCDCTDCVSLEDFKKYVNETTTLISRLARQDELDEKMLEVQRAVKSCVKNISQLVTRINGNAIEHDSMIKMITAGFEALTSLVNSQPVVISKTVTDNIKPKEPTPSGETKLVPQSYQPSVTGTIETIPQVKEVHTGDGPKQITEFDFNIDGEVVKMALWEDTGKEVVFKKVGDKLTLTAISVKNEYDGKLQLSSTRKTQVK